MDIAPLIDFAITPEQNERGGEGCLHTTQESTWMEFPDY